MNKLEILRMAFDKAKDPQEAMILARQMAEFINDGQPVQQTMVLESPKPKNNRKPWSKADIKMMLDLMEKNKSVFEIAKELHRTVKSVEVAMYKLATHRDLGPRKKAA